MIDRGGNRTEKNRGGGKERGVEPILRMNPGFAWASVKWSCIRRRSTGCGEKKGGGQLAKENIRRAHKAIA